MFKGCWRPQVRRLHRSASGSYRKSIPVRPAFWASSAVLASALWYSQRKVLHNDAAAVPFAPETKKPAWPSGSVFDANTSDTLTTLVWGSNRAKILSPLLPSSITIKKPFAATWLDNVALRDLALHERHAACVDVRGDVYQWGEGFASSGLDDGCPTRTLSGKGIVKLQLTDRRVFALSKSGGVYVLDSSASTQALAEPRAASWWKFWASPQLVDFVELKPQHSLGLGEKFVSISAGRDHLLALTSTGRTYSCPINQDANACGQLGFDAPALWSPAHIPKSIASPSYTAATSYNRRPPAADSPSDVGNDTIRFCTTLYEIPVLKGINIAQVATGTRSSFARTETGKVLAWGANERGQLGLGANFPSEPIAIPTEVVLWPTKAQESNTRCLGVYAGGNLTAFAVERAPANAKEAATVELLMCGDGQWGGLGNNLYSSAQISPVRVRPLSGLVEYNDATQRLQGIAPQSISISPTGHVLATLDPSSGGRDLHAWGRNIDYELGNGRKASVPSPMPVDSGNGRLLLQRKETKTVQNLRGGKGRNMLVEQVVAVGFGCTIIYWRPLS
ncbi:regulator of chromosome condensation 1/beta-lactamase-inhibitor protein II [Mycena latifolia]|nr:regulator of chromosome condensation 1/beta-lactamase-inhibitor protein II [Mycena latifolia]